MRGLDWVLYLGNERKAACVHAEDAAALVAIFGDGATVRHGRKVVWTEGSEDASAGASYDHAAGVMHKRAGVEVV
jgi:hypothetical protein